MAQISIFEGARLLPTLAHGWYWRQRGVLISGLHGPFSSWLEACTDAIGELGATIEIGG